MNDYQVKISRTGLGFLYGGSWRWSVTLPYSGNEIPLGHGSTALTMSRAKKAAEKYIAKHKKQELSKFSYTIPS